MNSSGKSGGDRLKSPSGKGFRFWFRSWAHWSAQAMGSPWAFLLAILAILAWAAMGPAFHYSDTWQLVINTATTIVTFLMVFLIQNTQNRDTRAMQLKLDVLLRGLKGARTSLVGLEELSDEDLEHLQKEFERLRGRARKPHSNHENGGKMPLAKPP